MSDHVFIYSIRCSNVHRTPGGETSPRPSALLQTWTRRWTVSEADEGPGQGHKCWRKNVIEEASPCADSVKSKTEQPVWCDLHIRCISDKDLPPASSAHGFRQRNEPAQCPLALRQTAIGDAPAGHGAEGLGGIQPPLQHL
mmetsp:Transcript_38347/g.75020  ORF Transcript_38347/g.75020 Transcript_38347/m.75020 type:complete len:141 (-) Transcript_38347:129-551(-)